MKSLIHYLFVALFLNSCSFAQKTTDPKTAKTSIYLRKQLLDIIRPYNATVGISVVGLEDQDTLTINNTHHFPMLSVYKFPLAVAVLHQVDLGKLKLDQLLHITKEELKPDTWSPIQRAYPAGNIDLSIAKLLRYTVAESDNNGCDILFNLLNGTKKVNTYIHKTGVKDIAITATEAAMSQTWDVQFTNWCTPSAMTQLLERLYTKKDLSETSTAFLLRIMTETSTGPNRIKGMLPTGVAVAHKTGTSGTNEQGVIAAVNDVGIVSLPNGKHLAIALFVSNSTESYETNEYIIAKITRAIYNYYSASTESTQRSIELIDTNRNRSIPIEVYENVLTDNNRVVILGGGYGSQNTDYSYIAHQLANDGYLVLSIQFVLPEDEPMATTGNIYELRKPVWERGVASIQFTMNELKSVFPTRNFNELILIGHSNGGDISMLFATQHPELVTTVVSLDHRRMPIPLISKPRILSIRASDFEADPSVLPTPEEQQKTGIKILELGEFAKHNDMDDTGSQELKALILEAIKSVLSEK